MFLNDMALQNQSTCSGSGHTKFSRRAETNSMDTDDYSRPSSPLHILPQVSYLRGSSYNKDDSKASQMSTSCGMSGPPSSYGSTSTNPEASPTPTTRRRDGVMRLESILNEVSVDPSYALWAASRKSRGSIDRDERYTLPAVEDVQESCAVLSDRASSEDADSEINSNHDTPVTSKRLHRCSECGKAFPRPSGLKTHMSIHTNEKPFTCTHPGCGRTFSVASNARRHMRLHGIGLDSDSSSPEQLSPLKVNFEQPIVVECSSGSIEGHRKLKWSAARLKTSAI